MKTKKSPTIIPFLAMVVLFLTAPAGVADPVVPGFHGTLSGVSSSARLPVPLPGGKFTGVSSLDYSGENRLVVHQNKDKAIIDWQSFNIAEDASAHFDQQKNADWAALNRIYDTSPSRIMGQLTADGKIYLINQNGILFGPEAQVNVHTLVASALNIRDEFFEVGDLKFQLENYQGSDTFDAATLAGVAVRNDGTIKAGETGAVYFFAPNVVNNSLISAPLGKIVFLAAGDLDTSNDPDVDLGLEGVEVEESGSPLKHVSEFWGEATNAETGLMVANNGLVGLYGRLVQQDGIITAVSAVKKTGRVELRAIEKVATGEKSLTAVPVTGSEETFDSSFGGSFPGKGDWVTLGGLEDEAVGVIDHKGAILAPGGNVTLEASERVYLDSASVIDVSGVWVGKAPDDMVVSAQLNTYELRNDYIQKSGILLGEWVSFSTISGSTIGDLVDYLKTETLTAAEFVTVGGNVEIAAPAGEIIAREGSLIDFSGGGFYYDSGAIEAISTLSDGNIVASPYLASGNRVYHISEAPEWLRYDKILGRFTKTHDRYGQEETYLGLDYGGAAPLNDYMDGYQFGMDAGSLRLDARALVLNGRLAGQVSPGLLQTRVFDTDALFASRWYREPEAGTLGIGTEMRDDLILQLIDPGVEAVVIVGSASSLPADFNVDSDLPERLYSDLTNDLSGEPILKSELSATMLSQAGLKSVKMNVLTTWRMEEDAVLGLVAGGGFEVAARRIEHMGTIRVSGGDVTLRGVNNVSSDADIEGIETRRPVTLNEGVLVGSGGIIDVAGNRFDNSLVGQEGIEEMRASHMGGGTVTIQDQSIQSRVIIEKNAFLDVSGGYVLAEDGGFEPGDAGSIALGASTLVLAGETWGLANVGASGGRISLQAGSVVLEGKAGTVSNQPMDDIDLDSELPGGFRNRLTLGNGNRLDGLNGFSAIHLKSALDLPVGGGVTLKPSALRFVNPLSGRLGHYTVPGVYDANPEGVVVISPDFGRTERVLSVESVLAGPSAVSLEAGKGVPLFGSDVSTPAELQANPAARVLLGSDARIAVSPAGDITLKGPGVDLSGVLDAPGGSVRITADGTQNVRDVILRDGCQIRAGGVNMPNLESRFQNGQTGYTALNGGSVSFVSEQGSIIASQGTRVDVSGSSPVPVYMETPDGRLESVLTASAPGEIAFKYYDRLRIEGVLDARPQMAGLQGGSLSLTKVNPEADGGLEIELNEIERFLEDGFDALKIASWRGLRFTGSAKLSLERFLELDAPEVLADNGVQVILSAPWLRIANTHDKYSLGAGGGGLLDPDSFNFIPDEAEPGTSSLQLTADWVDIEGSMVLSGFEQVDIQALRDIRLQEVKNYKGDETQEGKLKIPGDLRLEAACIYPTTNSEFTLSVPGRLETALSDFEGTDTVVSAGGSLILEVGDLNHEGRIAAPLGSVAIRFTNEDSRVYLAPGSLVSTEGASGVRYGRLNESLIWEIAREAELKEVTEAPVSDVSIGPASESLEDGEVIIREGARVDISGGGSVFAYRFYPGLEGDDFETSPLSEPGRYVLVPGMDLPGQTVVLNRSALGLAAGVYSVLPEEYAFLPGAYVVEDVGAQERLTGSSPGLYSDYGYPLVAGRFGVSGTDLEASGPRVFAVREAEDVIQEGHLEIQEFIAGDAGGLVMRAPTVVLEGEVRAVPLSTAYQGGDFQLVGAENILIRGLEALEEDFSFESPLPELYLDRLNLRTDPLQGSGIRKIQIGDENIARTITMADGAAISAPEVLLIAGAFKDRVETEGESPGDYLAPSVVFQTGSSVRAEGAEGFLGIYASASIDHDEDGKADFQIGDVCVEEGAEVFAGSTISLTTSGFQNDGLLETGSSSLSLISNEIHIISDEYTLSSPGDLPGLVLTETLAGFQGIKVLELSTPGTIAFHGDVDFNVPDALLFDSVLISGQGEVEVSSAEIHVLNSSGTSVTLSDSDNLDNIGTFSLTAETITVGHGDVEIDGFERISLNAESDVLFSGKGQLTTTFREGEVPDVDLGIVAARISGTVYQDEGTSYEAVDFSVNAGVLVTELIYLPIPGFPPIEVVTRESVPFKNISISRSGGEKGHSSAVGGRLSFLAEQIESAGVTELAGGRLEMVAAGSGGEGSLLLGDGAEVIVSGTEHAPGGVVILESWTGDVRHGQGALIDVSAGGGTNAGRLKILAPEGDVILNGTVSGHANGGIGGSFTQLSKRNVDESGNVTNVLDSELRKLAGGGFDHRIDIRVETGDIRLDESVRADGFSLAADGGTLTINGDIDVSSTSVAGDVELYAGSDLHINGDISAAYMGDVSGPGGTVTMGSAEGWVNIDAGTVIDVSGDGAENGGIVYFRAGQTETGTKMDLSGAIVGASKVIAEAFQVYAYDGDYTVNDPFPFAPNDFDSLTSPLMEDGLDAYFIPGVEIRSTGDLYLDAAWDLADWRYGDNQVPGVLTLRAENNLYIQANLTDSPNDLSFPSDLDSWGINLIAGADMEGGSPLATRKAGEGNGDLVIAPGKYVFTESAFISLASGGDVQIDNGALFGFNQDEFGTGYEIGDYNIATFDGDIRVDVTRDLVLYNAAIQSAVGDIDLGVGGDVLLHNSSDFLGKQYGGAIRTVGSMPQGVDASKTNRQWHLDGGNIRLDVDGAVLGNVYLNAWDQVTADSSGGRYWSARYDTETEQATGQDRLQATTGIVTLGGGNVDISCGGEFHGQAGTFGQLHTGDLSLFAGGDVNGRFLVFRGHGEINSAGNFGTRYEQDQVLELFDTRFRLLAQGEVQLGAVYNPTIARTRPFTRALETEFASLEGLYLLYSEETSILLTSVNEDIVVSGKSGPYETDTRYVTYLPPTVEMAAPEGNIELKTSFSMVPYEQGNLRLEAGRDILGTFQSDSGATLTAQVLMSDYRAQDSSKSLYAWTETPGVYETFLETRNDLAKLIDERSNPPLHLDDDEPVVIQAGRDIQGFNLVFPKAMEVVAGRDVKDIQVNSSNLRESDISILKAGRDIRIETLVQEGFSTREILHGGPGNLLVQAGNNIELGVSKGIYASNEDAGLPQGSDLTVIAGYDKDWAVDELTEFFEVLKKEGKAYTESLQSGPEEAARLIDETRRGVIQPFFSGAVEGEGNIEMTRSSIIAREDDTDLSIIAAGTINVGKSFKLESSEGTEAAGIRTDGGGGVNIYAGKDVNVLESRIMTTFGGDILIWSDYGDINAGKGSKTEISNPGQKAVIDEVSSIDPVTGEVVTRQAVVGYVTKSPAIGSGIRTHTFDPDGLAGPIEPPELGDAYLVAPEGIIDAGEAGIEAKSIYIGAKEVRNVQNIESSGVAVGVPQPSEGAGNVGALSGAGELGKTVSDISNEAGMEKAREKAEQTTESLAKAFTPKWLKVEFVGFDE